MDERKKLVRCSALIILFLSYSAKNDWNFSGPRYLNENLNLIFIWSNSCQFDELDRFFF